MVILLILPLYLSLCLKKSPFQTISWILIIVLSSGIQANLLLAIVEIKELNLERFDEIFEFFFQTMHKSSGDWFCAATLMHIFNSFNQIVS
jgi:hypothetical protein